MGTNGLMANPISDYYILHELTLAPTHDLKIVTNFIYNNNTYHFLYIPITHWAHEHQCNPLFLIGSNTVSFFHHQEILDVCF